MSIAKIKILHYGLSVNNGGVEASILRTAQSINKERFELHFIIAKGQPACFQEELQALGGVFHEITARRTSFFNNRRDLNRLFKEQRFDVLHMHLCTLSYISPVRYARKNGVACVLHSRSSSATSMRVRLLHYLNRAVQPKRTIARVAVSTQAGRWLFGSRLAFDVLPNGVNTSKYAFDEKERILGRHEFALSEDCLVLGYVGAFLPVKNHGFLIDIAEELAGRGANFAMMLIGAGPELEKIKALANAKGVSANIKFLGARKDVGRLYSIMDALVFPSKFEGFPNVVLEAQASGLPCLVSTAIPREILLSELCQSLDLELGAEAWATRLLAIKAQSIEDRKLAKQRVAFSGFSVESEIAKIESLYDRMLLAKSESATSRYL